ncbi:MAG: patatin-like phospholipase family protein [Rhodospirillales bacterium]|nr:patatin-like phospholipase family protein [Rhodospirillales bacterium]
MTSLRIAYVVAALAFFLQGCAVAPFDRFYATDNNESPSCAANSTRASLKLVSEGPGKDYFVGLALSGGGSRAANFSAAVMLELEKADWLKHVQYISSVSGSSLPAAYYALFGDDEEGRWNETVIRKTFSQCFECWWAGYVALPHRLVRFLGTGYDRTDAMIDVFNDRIFDGRRFADFRSKDKAPRLIINATDYHSGNTFRFENDAFDKLCSNLADLPVARAVGASAAFPGLLNNVTFRNFSPKAGTQRYVHTMDGGVADNLGLETLLGLAKKFLDKNGSPQRCLIIAVDAHLSYDKELEKELPDTRGPLDAFIDSNAVDAFSIILADQRITTIRELGFDRDHLDAALKDNEPIGLLEVSKMGCKVWHIALTQLQPWRVPKEPSLPIWQPWKISEPTVVKKYNQQNFDPKVGRYSKMGLDLPADFYKKCLATIPTRFQIDETKMGLDLPADFYKKCLAMIPTRFQIDEKRVDDLYLAAQFLVQEDQTKKRVSQWFDEILHGE